MFEDSLIRSHPGWVMLPPLVVLGAWLSLFPVWERVEALIERDRTRIVFLGATTEKEGPLLIGALAGAELLLPEDPTGAGARVEHQRNDVWRIARATLGGVVKVESPDPGTSALGDSALCLPADTLCGRIAWPARIPTAAPTSVGEWLSGLSQSFQEGSSARCSLRPTGSTTEGLPGFGLVESPGALGVVREEWEWMCAGWSGPAVAWLIRYPVSRRLVVGDAIAVLTGEGPSVRAVHTVPPVTLASRFGGEVELGTVVVEAPEPRLRVGDYRGVLRREPGRTVFWLGSAPAERSLPLLNWPVRTGWRADPPRPESPLQLRSPGGSLGWNDSKAIHLGGGSKSLWLDKGATPTGGLSVTGHIAGGCVGITPASGIWPPPGPCTAPSEAPEQALALAPGGWVCTGGQCLGLTRVSSGPFLEPLRWYWLRYAVLAIAVAWSARRAFSPHQHLMIALIVGAWAVLSGLGAGLQAAASLHSALIESLTTFDTTLRIHAGFTYPALVGAALLHRRRPAARDAFLMALVLVGVLDVLTAARFGISLGRGWGLLAAGCLFAGAGVIAAADRADGSIAGEEALARFVSGILQRAHDRLGRGAIFLAPALVIITNLLLYAVARAAPSVRVADVGLVASGLGMLVTIASIQADLYRGVEGELTYATWSSPNSRWTMALLVVAVTPSAFLAGDLGVGMVATSGFLLFAVVMLYRVHGAEGSSGPWWRRVLRRARGLTWELWVPAVVVTSATLAARAWAARDPGAVMRAAASLSDRAGERVGILLRAFYEPNVSHLLQASWLADAVGQPRFAPSLHSDLALFTIAGLGLGAALWPWLLGATGLIAAAMLAWRRTSMAAWWLAPAILVCAVVGLVGLFSELTSAANAAVGEIIEANAWPAPPPSWRLLAPVVVTYLPLAAGLVLAAKLVQERWSRAVEWRGRWLFHAVAMNLPLLTACLVASHLVVLVAGTLGVAPFTGVAAPLVAYGGVSALSWSVLLSASLLVATYASVDEAEAE